MEFNMKVNSVKTLLVLGVMLLSLPSIGQSSKADLKDEKAIDKCWKTFHSKGYDKGIEKLEKYMAKQTFSSFYAYESLVSMEYQNYMYYQNLFGDVNMTTTDENGDSSVVNLQDLMVSLFRGHFIAVCRKSTIESTSPTADMYLRKYLVDFEPDSLVSEKAKSYYDEAEQFFGKEDYELADLNYRKAIREDSTYYLAYLYLGDSFWAREKYDSAMVYYTIARDLQPNLLEPRLYIVDALSEQGLFYRAKKEAIAALTVYPGYNLKYKLQRILNKENKWMNEHRIIRTFYPNDITNDEQSLLLNNPIWKDYRAAKEDVKKYCDSTGIIEPNGEYQDRYLEVYSVRRMLEKHPNDLPEELHFADKMREAGLLEPYVLICLFHVDIYDQFKHYMASEENRTKSIDFVEKYLIESTN